MSVRSTPSPWINSVCWPLHTKVLPLSWGENCLVCGVEFWVTKRVYLYGFICFAETSRLNNDCVYTSLYVCKIVKDWIIMNAYALSIVRAGFLLSSTSFVKGVVTIPFPKCVDRGGSLLEHDHPNDCVMFGTGSTGIFVCHDLSLLSTFIVFSTKVTPYQSLQWPT